MKTSQTLVVPMKSKDNLVAWVKNHAKLPEIIDKDEYELTKWSTLINQVKVMETSQTLEVPMILKDKKKAWKTSSNSKVPTLAMAVESIAYDPSVESCKFSHSGVPNLGSGGETAFWWKRSRQKSRQRSWKRTWP